MLPLLYVHENKTYLLTKVRNLIEAKNKILRKAAVEIKRDTHLTHLTYKFDCTYFWFVFIC